MCGCVKENRSGAIFDNMVVNVFRAFRSIPQKAKGNAAKNSKKTTRVKKSGGSGGSRGGNLRGVDLFRSVTPLHGHLGPQGSGAGLNTLRVAPAPDTSA